MTTEEPQRLEYLDDLTGLFNRRYFRERLLAEKRRADHEDSSFALMMIDLDNFKPINDLHGHLSGDRVLSQVGRLLKECIRSTDTLCRYAGDEFAAILPEIEEKSIIRTAQRIQKHLARAEWADDQGEAIEPVTCSLGYAFYSRAGRDLNGLISWADQALYAAKHRGGNGCCGEKELSTVVTDRPLLTTPSIIGRDKELRRLKSIVEEVRKQGGRLVEITGEAGIGKTRVLREVRQFLERRGGLALWGSCHEETRAIPYYPFRETFAAFFDERRKEGISLLKGLPNYSRREVARIVPNLREHKVLDAERTTDPFPLFESVRLFLEKLGTESPMPLLFAVEDLQWADNASLDLMHYLSRTLRKAPVLLLVTYRTEEKDREARLAGLIGSLRREELSEEVQLKPLSPDAVAIMLRLLRPGKTITRDLRDSFYGKTEGNPFFVEELVKFLGARSTEVSDAGELEMPESVSALLKKRIHSLDPEMRETLSCAALVGEEFEFDVLCAVLARPRHEVLDALEEASKAHIVRESLEGPDDRYRFMHSLMVQVLYSDIGRLRKKLWHGQTGDALLSLYEGRLGVLNGRLTYHFERSEQWDKALACAVRSAAQAKEDYANREALKLYQKAGQILPKLPEATDEQAIEISQGLGEVYQITGEYEKALEQYRTVENLARRAGDRKKEAESLSRISRIYHLKGDHEKTEEHAKKSYDIYREIGEPGGVAECLHTMGNVHWSRGEYPQALKNYEDALAKRRELGDMRGASSSLQNIGNVCLEQGEYDRALECYEKTLAMRKEANDRRGLAASLNGIGNVHANRGDYDEALSFYKDSLAVRREIGDRRGIASSLNNIGTVYADKGEYEKALEHYRNAFEIEREIGNRRDVALALNNIGTIHWKRGAYSEALRNYEESLVLRREIGDKQGAAVSLQNIAIVNETYGDYTSAVKNHQESLKVRKALKDRQGIALSLHSLGVIYSTMGEYAKALKILKEALSLQREIGDRRRIASTLHSIAGVYAYQGEYVEALRCYQKALGIENEIGDRWSRAITLMEIGSLYQDLGDIEGSAELHKTALVLMDELGIEAEKAELLTRLGIDLLLQGKEQDALKEVNEALVLTERLGAEGVLPSVLEGLAQVWFSLGNKYEALHFCDRLLVMATERALKRYVAVAKMLKGQIAQEEAVGPEREGLKDSESQLKDARRTAKQIGALPLVWRIEASLGMTYEARGETRKASREYAKARKIVDELCSKIDDQKLREAFLDSAPVKSLLAKTED
jgi:diguanylate cyclase (GGDEF)-like protein